MPEQTKDVEFLKEKIRLLEEANERLRASEVRHHKMIAEKKAIEERLLESTRELQGKNEALRKSEERYHKMIAEVQDYAIILLDTEGNIRNWNTGAEKIKGYTTEEAIGKNFRVFYTPHDRENCLPEQLLNRAATTGKAVQEGWRVRKDGSTFWGSIVITALHASDGSIIGFSKVTRDLTERKRAEDQSQEYLRELEAQNRELEQFVYIASHDLQEPLRKIQLFIDVLEKNFDNRDLARDYLARITSSAQRMVVLIKSVLNYSKLSNPGEEFVDTDLNKVLKAVKQDFELYINDKRAVIASAPLPVIKAIPTQVSQLFSNLISNALKFSDKDPVVQIYSRVVPREEILHAPQHLTADEYVEIAFADNGIGFDQQFEDRIFSMFQRLHSRDEYSGTGIGLALCKKIMDNHKGYITVTSEFKKGATFYVYFPV